MRQDRSWWSSALLEPWQARDTVLDFPAWPVHPPHHAPHCVPPQDGDAQVLAGPSVLDDLVVVVSSLMVEGQSVVQRPEVPPHARIGNDNDSLSSGFACSSQVWLAKAVFYPVVTQQWCQSILLQGAVFGLAHGQCHWKCKALQQECCSDDDGHDWLPHGEDLPGGVKRCLRGWVSLQRWRFVRSDSRVGPSAFISFRAGLATLTNYSS